MTCLRKSKKESEENHLFHSPRNCSLLDTRLLLNRVLLKTQCPASQVLGNQPTSAHHPILCHTGTWPSHQQTSGCVWKVVFFPQLLWPLTTMKITGKWGVHPFMIVKTNGKVRYSMLLPWDFGTRHRKISLCIQGCHGSRAGWGDGLQNDPRRDRELFERL